MLKGDQKRIAPVKLSEEHVQNILQELEARQAPQRPPWLGRAVRGGLFVAVVVVVFLSLVFLVRIIGGGAASEAETPASPQATGVPTTPPDGNQAQLSVVTTPREATVYLNGDSVGVTPLLAQTFPKGDYTISLRKQGYAPFDTMLSFQDNLGFYHPLRPGEALDDAIAGDRAALPEPALPEPVAHQVSLTDSASSIATRQQDPVSRDEPLVSERRSSRTEPDPTPPEQPDDAAARRKEEQYQRQGERGDALFNAGDYEKAISAYEQMFRYKPGDAYGLEMIAESRRQLELLRARPEPAAPIAEQTEPAPSAPARPMKLVLRRTERDKAIDPSKDVTIVRVDGKATLEVNEIENFRIVTKPGGTPPTLVYWESESGVFARGRSVDVQFGEAGTYSVTVTALNDHYADRVSFDVTVTPPVLVVPSQPVERVTRPRAPSWRRRGSRAASRTARTTEEPPAETPAFEHAMLYNSKGIAVGQGGYAWVVATHLDRQAAMSDMVRYRVAGFRSGTFEEAAAGAGSVAYRVLIGHFPTQEAALQARNQLPEDVPGGVWLLDMTSTPN